jgi:hypothetical protein
MKPGMTQRFHFLQGLMINELKKKGGGMRAGTGAVNN